MAGSCKVRRAFWSCLMAMFGKVGTVVDWEDGKGCEGGRGLQNNPNIPHLSLTGGRRLELRRGHLPRQQAHFCTVDRSCQLGLI